MEVILLCGGLTLMVIGAVLGRAHERSVWQRRLLERAGMIGPDLHGLGRLEAMAARQRPGRPIPTDPALDAIALEVERISEGQRFLTQVLAEREQRSTGRSKSPSSGPHRAARTGEIS